MILALDTETSGLDLRHGARPFLVTTCDDSGTVRTWTWSVDSLTRKPAVVESDLDEIEELVSSADRLVLHNSKFDVAALASVRPRIGENWPWDRTDDTLLLAHLLHSNQPKDLTSLSVRWLRYDSSPYERKLEEATKAARRVIQQAKLRVKRAAEKGLDDPDDPLGLARWKIADDGMEDDPSLKGERKWAADYWLPAALAKHYWESSIDGRDGAGGDFDWRPPESNGEDDPGHPYWTVLGEYADSDSQLTMAVYRVMKAEVDRRGRGQLYEARRKLLPVAYRMEAGGVTMHRGRTEELVREYSAEVEDKAAVMTNLAAGDGYELTVGKAANASLRGYCFDVLKLPHVRGKKAKTDAPSLGKEAIEHFKLTVPRGSRAGSFVNAYATRQKKQTAIQYMQSYLKFCKPLDCSVFPGWSILYPSLNLADTGTLRAASSRPNGQNISKQDAECDRCGDERGNPELRPDCYLCRGTGKSLRSLRYCFGPLPGREWWSLDAKNIELRLPFYASGEEALIELFERPDDPPFYGSNHILNFSVIYPDLWDSAVKEVGLTKAAGYVKKRYKDTWYQWCKNGNFAIQYNAGRATADAAYHRAGAYDLLKSRFTKLEELNRSQIGKANRLGYVETMPDRSVDPDRGYPLLCTRTERGSVLETVPLSYHVQGTAMWWTAQAMIRVQDCLDDWNRTTGGRVDGRIVLQVHDELVIDLPRRADPKLNPKSSNLSRVHELRRLMSLCGGDLLPVPVPTPVGAEWHDESWAEGVTVA